MTFWMTLAANTEARATDGTHLTRRMRGGRHVTYLRSLPRVAPDPLPLLDEEHVVLLGGTPIGRETK